RRSMEVDRSEQKDLSRRSGRHRLNDRPSISDRGDLIFGQSDVLPEESLQIRLDWEEPGTAAVAIKVSNATAGITLRIIAFRIMATPHRSMCLCALRDLTRFAIFLDRFKDILIDPHGSDLRLQCGCRYAEPGSGAQRARHTASGFRESRVDDFAILPERPSEN